MNLSSFHTLSLYDASADMFQQLGIKVNSNTSEPLPIEGLLKQHLKDTEIFKSITKTFFIGIIDDSVFQQMSLFKGDYSYSDALHQADRSYDGLMFFALELAKQPTRTEISNLTRAFNRISQKMPVALILKYKMLPTLSEKGAAEVAISITISERFKYKQNWRQGEKTGKVIILRDVKTINTHAGHQRILLDLVKPVGVNNYAQLHEHWLQVLDVSVLNKQFYQKLFNWYLWALTKAEFPQIRPEEDKIKNDVHQSESLIRLLSRLLFCWFMKEKGLINPNLFNIDYLRKILKGFEGIRSEETIYYKAILQNLFFATLNKPIEERKIIDKGFNKKEYGDPLVYRYEDLFKDSKSVLSHFENIPFLNGGLFDCLDQKKDKDNPVEIRLDGFSTKKDKQPIMPDMFFFGEYDGIDLSEEYDDKRKSKVKVFGLLDILHQYKFTIEENTPLEEEIALDPELLGKVFENLLASYNPETKTTARKQTGSFYTPREIVNYMVDESLLCYLKNTIDDEERLRNLFSYNETVNPFDKKETRLLIEAINTAKILDPACGSGAFPMGVLQKLIHILHKLDPENKIWFELVIANFPSAMQNVARQRLEKENWNFVRKLGIIQECIYGVDIQPIAIQISKLRFFISLLVDQTERPKEPNRGFEPLPNLDFKLIAANTLIAAPESDTVTTGLFAGQTDPFFQQFDLLTNEYFNVHLPKDKKDKKQEILKLIDNKIAEKQKQLKRAIDVRNKKQTDAGEIEIKLWGSYANLFKNEAVGFLEIQYFFPNVKEGFDIVIGNPPYVFTRDADFGDDFKEYITKKYFTLLTANEKKSKANQSGKINLFALFILRGLLECRKGGILTFIVPNNLLRTTTYDLIRKYLLQKSQIDEIVDLGSGVFDNVTASTIIFRVSNQINLSNKTKIITEIENIEQKYFTQSAIEQSQFLNNVSYTFNLFADTSVNNLLTKISNSTKHLGDFCIDIIEGIVAHKHLISEVSTKYNQPLLEGKTIKKYLINPPNKFITWNKEEIHRTRPEYLWNSKKKILIQRISGGLSPLSGTIDTKKYKTFASINNLLLKEEYSNLYEFILALINSKVLNWFYANSFSNNSNLTVNISKTFLEKLPIAEYTKPQVNIFTHTVSYILFLKQNNEISLSTFFERLVDAMVYELYLPDEINVAGCNVLEHLTSLPELREEWDDEQKLKTIEKEYKQLSNPTHPISAALLKLLNVEEVKIIEGIK